MLNKNDKIKLELSERISFPDKCIYCGRENPNGTVPLSPPEEENGNGGDRMVVFAVPACHACAISQSARKKQISNVAFAVFLVIFTCVGTLLLKAYHSLIFITLGVLIVAILYSLDALRTMRQKIVIDCVNHSTVVFHSPDREYAEEFKTMNSALMGDK